MTNYYYAPGYANPYWCVYEAKWSDGKTETVAHNSASGTDMGDLFDDEFERFFPHAIEITEQQYADQSIDKHWAMAEARRRAVKEIEDQL